MGTYIRKAVSNGDKSDARDSFYVTEKLRLQPGRHGGHLGAAARQASRWALRLAAMAGHINYYFRQTRFPGPAAVPSTS
jgi:hypothetical protein